MFRRRLIVTVLALILLVPSLAVAFPAPTKLLDTTMAASIAGAPMSVRIDRDPYGVPHVYADDVYGLFWGNGYAQAQDRLFQMDVLRHVGKGDSAQYLGPSQLDMDLTTRRELYTDEERTASFAALSPADKLMFQAFADGVNAFIQTTILDPTTLSAEFYAIGHVPEQWVPEDTIAVAQFLLDIFGAGSGGNEVENAKLLFHLIETLGAAEAEKAFNDFFWMHDTATYTSVPSDEYTYATTEGPLNFNDIPALQWEIAAAAAGATAFAGPMNAFETAQHALGGLKFGSNALIVSPALTESGGAIMFGGPQMAYHNPMVPYEVALHGAGFNAVGMGVGGAPGVIIGRNTNMAWTVTSGSSDQVDVVAVKLVPGNARQYYVDNVPTDMDCRLEVHFGPPTAIDQNPPVLATQEVCRTVRGPVFAMNEDAGYAFVRERTHRLDELRSGLLWLTLAQNEDLASFQAHMETFCFEFNFHIADNLGNIAYNHFGCQPVRASGYDPRLPRLAGEWDWVDIRRGADLPHITNPAKGYIVNWNNKPADGWSSGDAMEKWGPVHRANLIEKAVQGKFQEDGTLNVQDLRDINEFISKRSPFPPHFVPALASAVIPTSDAMAQAAIDALIDWGATSYGWDHFVDNTGTERYVSPGFAIYEKWRGLAQERVFRDELGPHMRELGFNPPATSDPHAGDHGREDNKDNVLYNALTGRSAHAWFDDVSTPGVETVDDMLRATFAEAIAELASEYGTTDVSKWLQPIHHIKFVALSGGPAWEIPMVNRPSFNHFYDWGTGDAWSVMPPGTNQYWKPIDFLRYSADGTFPDAHKYDQLELYKNFEYKPAQLHPAMLESSSTYTI